MHANHGQVGLGVVADQVGLMRFPSARVTSSRLAPWTTWLLVRMYPLDVKTNPEPLPWPDRLRLFCE